MTYYENKMKITKDFYDTIDFKKFMSADYRISTRSLMDCIEEYYDESHPELLPEELNGSFFNYMDEQDFALYLKERYGFGLIENTVIEYVLLRTDAYGKPISKEQQK